MMIKGEQSFDLTTIAARLTASAEGLDGVATAVPGLGLTAAAVTELLATVRLVQRRTVGVVAALTQMALINSRDGTGPVVEDVLAADGTVGRSETRAEIERARVVDSFPEVGVGVAGGSVHTGNADVLARLTSKMSKDEIDVLSRDDTGIAKAASRLSEDSFRKRVQRMRDKIRDDHGGTAHQQAVDDAFARVSLTRDRSAYRIVGQFDAVLGSAIQAALAREYRWLINQPELVGDLTSDQAMAQALHDLIMRGDSVDRDGVDGTTGSTRPNVSILVLTDHKTLESGPHEKTVAETDDGTRLDPATVGRLCCDARLRRLDLLPDANVAVSHSGRTTTPAQRAGLRAMYESCPISGAPWSQCEIHHVIFYRNSGHTVLSELVPISRRWHHLVHEGGWTLTIDADRTLILSRPDGTTHKTIPYTPANQTSTKDDHSLAA